MTIPKQLSLDILKNSCSKNYENFTGKHQYRGFFFQQNFYFLLRIFTAIQKKNPFKTNNKNTSYIKQLLKLPLLKHTHTHTHKITK